MMGRQLADQRRFFYDFCLEDVVPLDHLLRRIDGLLDLGEVRQQLKPHYSHKGRPSVDPELMIRMLIVGYCYGIRFERRLCEEVHLNLAYRWFCRLGLEDAVPDHSTFSLNRHGRFRQSNAFRLVFETVLQRCMAAGLVGGEGFAIDASVLEADASRYHGIAPDKIDLRKIENPSRAIRDYIAALDEAGELEPGRKPPKVISPSDPASAWTAKANKRVQFGYGLNYLIDNEHAIIVDVEATPARTYDEVVATRTMINRTEERFDLKPRRLAADTAYGTGRMLDWLIKRNIEPHIPVWNMTRLKEGIFSREAFIYDKDRDLYICPNGKELRTSGTAHDGTTLKYIAKRSDCKRCPLKQRCTSGRERRVQRDVNEAARDYARSLVGTEPYEQSRRERKKVEMLFAHLKRHLGFERMRLRGLSGAQDEFLLVATVQNLRRLAKLTTIPPPTPVTAR